jgi:hypothetical protein
MARKSVIPINPINLWQRRQEPGYATFVDILNSEMSVARRFADQWTAPTTDGKQTFLESNSPALASFDTNAFI